MPKPDRARPERCFTVFGRNGVMPGRTGSENTGKVSWKREGALREFWPGTPL
ncbi:hypothetical protein GQ221_004123 [Salmonella enterica]|nr:hypothetical protein [Salmonella enterica]EDW4676637.1 hypothetical protein [Salmonella enterica subsp. arizonae]